MILSLTKQSGSIESDDLSLDPQNVSSPHHSICSSLKEERSSPSSIIKEEISNTSSITSMYPNHSHNLQNDNSSGMHHDAHNMSHSHQAQDEQMDKISYRGIFTTTDTSSAMLSKFDIDLGRQMHSPQMTLLPSQMSPPSTSISGWNLPSPDKLFQPPLFLLGTQGKQIIFASFALSLSLSVSYQ